MFARFQAKFIAGVGALTALTLLALPVRAGELASNFGPVGPSEPILATLGGQHVIAFFVPERGSCAVNAIIWKDAEADAPYASSRVKVSLRPGRDGSVRRGQEVDEPALRRGSVHAFRGGAA